MIEYSPINIRTWARLGSCGAFGAAMQALAEEDPSLAVVTADLCFYSGLDRFKQRHPDKLYNVGIAEQNLLGVAAGMASEGLHVFATTYATFATTRALDQVRVCMGYMQLPVKLVGLTSGLTVSILGATHTGNEDLAILRSIPNLTILSPADTTSTVKAVLAANQLDGPVYLRLSGAMGAPLVYKQDFAYEIGKSITLRTGDDIAIFATGTMVAEALQVAELLATRGIQAEVVDMHTIKPFDQAAVEAVMDRRLIVTMEEHSVIGGIGSAVAELLAARADSPALLRLGLADIYLHAGERRDLMEEYELQTDVMAEKIIARLAQGENA